jgi:hypothetical protein
MTTTDHTQVQLHEHRIYEDIFSIHESEFIEIGRYVALTDDNLKVYSNKIHELHLRVCSEIETALKKVVEKNFVSREQVFEKWDSQKSFFLAEKGRENDYKNLKVSFNSRGSEKLDELLFGHPDFSFYFKLACNEFHLNQKVVVCNAGLTTSENLHVIQPFETSLDKDVPNWWTSYNKLKHDKINFFSSCNLGDLLHSLAGFYILMNYLTKYRPDNEPTYNPDYFRDHPASNSVYVGCNYWEATSKIFKSSCIYTAPFDWKPLPMTLSRDEYELLSRSEGGLGAIPEIADDGDPLIRKLNMQEHCIFHTYFDYVERIDSTINQSFMTKERFGKFVN